LFLSEVTQQIKSEQNNEHKAEPTTTTDMPSISISTATEDKNKDNDKENEGHGNIFYRGFTNFDCGRRQGWFLFG
jgi:hypothetical protein